MVFLVMALLLAVRGGGGKVIIVTQRNITHSVIEYFDTGDITDNDHKEKVILLEGIKDENKQIKNISIVLSLDTTSGLYDTSSVSKQIPSKSLNKSTTNAINDVFINLRNRDFKEITNASEAVEKESEDNKVDIRDILIKIDLIQNKEKTGKYEKNNQKICKPTLRKILNTPLFYGDIILTSVNKYPEPRLG